MRRPPTAEEAAEDPNQIRVARAYGTTRCFAGRPVVHIYGSDQVVEPAELPMIMVNLQDPSWGAALPGLLDRDNRTLLQARAEAAWEKDPSLHEGLPLVEVEDLHKPGLETAPQLKRPATIAVDPMSPDKTAAKKPRSRDAPAPVKELVWDVAACKNQVMRNFNPSLAHGVTWCLETVSGCL